MLNVTNITPPRVPLVDARTGLISREWYRFLLNLFTLTGSGASSATLEDLQLVPPAIDYSVDITKIRADLEIGTAPFPNFGTLAYQNAENVTVGRLNTVDPTTGISHGSIYENSSFLVLDGTAGVVQSYNGVGRTVTQNTGFRPFVDNTYDLGTASQTWQSLYTTDIWFRGSAAKNLYSNSSFSIIDGVNGSIMACNGAPVAIAQPTAFRPYASSSYTLGTSGQRWTSVYADELVAGATGDAQYKENSGFAFVNGTNGVVTAFNGTPITVTQATAFRPYASSSCTLGTSGQRWTSVYADELIAGTTGDAQYKENSGFAFVNGTNGVVTAFNSVPVTVSQATAFRPYISSAFTLGTSGQRWTSVYAEEVLLTASGTTKFYDSSSFAVIDGANGSIMAFNGTAIAVAQATGLRPFASNTYSLGTSGQRWTSVYANEVVLQAAGTTKFYDSSSFAVIDGANGSIMAANGAAVAIAQYNALRPNASSTFSLGTSTQQWTSVYANELVAGASGAAQYKESSGFALVNGTNGVVTAFNGTGITVTQATGFRPFADNTYTLGTSGQRWSEVYAAVGTINTSDGSQKQQVRDLTEAEHRVAKSIKGLIRAYKFNDAVESKGDDARIHIGVIAQDVQAAFAAEGLDAAKYGLFCSDTWTTLDGKTETRLGVRYSELLAFVIAAL